jgi:hypothetical protein
VFGIIQDVFSFPSFPTPVFSTIRDWLLKLGVFNLGQTHEAGKWVWIIDCSIQIGAMKCLLILGVRLDILQKRGNFILSHSDVKPIVLKTVESCPGEIVKEALDEAKKKTQGVVEIISDEGSELKRGVRLFQEEQLKEQKPVHLHDITHKIDLVLKKELKNDYEWKSFTKRMTHTTQTLKHSSSSHLIPPKQRQKNRMRSEIDIIEWGIKICSYLDSKKANELEKEKLSWVLNYRRQLSIYQEMAILFDMSTQEVREQGYRQETTKILKKKGAIIANSKRSRSFFSKILKTIEQEVKKIPKDSCLLGCSEVIESAFGKFKQLEKNHASGGLTSLVLSLPALLGDTSMEVIKEAMEKVSIKQVKEWIKENLGSTFWSQRRSNLSMSNELKDGYYLESDDFTEIYAS